MVKVKCLNEILILGAQTRMKILTNQTLGPVCLLESGFLLESELFSDVW